MSQGVTYADLQFVRAPPENTPRPRPLQEGAEEGDLTYENIRAAEPQGEDASGSSKQHKGPKKPFWPITWGLLGASLLLLAATLGFGVRYRQVSWHLREASEASAAANRSLARALDAQDRALLQMQGKLREAEAELNRSQAALRESRQLVSSIQGGLQEKEATLATATQKRQEAEEALNATLAKACVGWCPEEWLLHAGKCLFFSTQAKTWRDSKRDCEEERSARLLTAKPEAPLAVPRPLESNPYWNGCYRWSTKAREWVDGSHCEGAYRCTTVKTGQRAEANCYRKHQYICEKPPRPEWPDPRPV